jgi:phage tail sheath protein FI
MAEILLSPGVLATETDTSFVTAGPVTAGAAIIGPTVKGPVEIPTVVTSYSDYLRIFGDVFTSGSTTNQQQYAYFTSTAASNYFANGGTSLLVARVVTGSYTSATSSLIVSASGATIPVFTLETFTQGAIANSSGSEDASGVLANGTIDNLRWQIANSNTASGTFDLYIRYGNDTTANPSFAIPAQTFAGVSLDPYSDRFITKIVGDQKFTLVTNDGYYLQTSGSYKGAGQYVRIKSVNITTPNYFLNDGFTPNPALTGSLPINQSGSFGGAAGTIKGNAKFYDQISNTDSQGLTAGNYTNMINLLSNRDSYQFNVISTPGLCYNFPTNTSTMDLIISNAQNRGDNIYILDLVQYGQPTATVTGKAAAINSSYAAAYWPWVQVFDATGQQVWVPASTMIAGVYAYNDSVSEPWFAPAGINRGGISTVLSAERMLSSTQRDTLYTGKVNPIATFPNTPGVVVFGQKTLQTRASALDRVNVRRLLIAVKSYISQVANTLVFEQNTAATRNNFLAQVNPYLESVQQRQGLYAFKVIMDDTNNTPTVIDQNQMVGQIYLQPTKTAEFIYLDFNITPTGATFPA